MAGNSEVRAVLDKAEYAAHGWSGKDAATVAAELHTLTVPVVVSVGPSRKREIAATHGVLRALELGKETAPNDTLKALCYDAVEFYRSDEAYVRADHKALLDALSTGDVVIPAAFTAALDGECDSTQTIAQFENISGVDPGGIEKARAL